MYVNLFSEVEPFAVILIAHGAHIFFGGLQRPEVLKFEATCLEWGMGFGGGSSEPHQLWDLEERYTPKERGAGPRLQIHFGPTKSLHYTTSGRKCRTHSLIFC